MLRLSESILEVGRQWLMSVMLALEEAEIRGMAV
jgi:hypothetical protein